MRPILTTDILADDHRSWYIKMGHCRCFQRWQ
ncbi:unnamed protein product [Nippostrongylus brasiliensis]|uniref:DUF2575 domain-containing protein n=1 Tax=Nippostrongylus brasiliensis TaxID=27835 RepID=A0A0N4YHZ7_NIPBR|nr:unnamed protein product [Nippostrongylus brasiliensis]